MKWVHLAHHNEPDWRTRPRVAATTLLDVGAKVYQIERGYDTSTGTLPAIRATIQEQVGDIKPDVLFIEGATAAVTPSLVTPALLQRIRPHVKTILLWWGEVRARRHAPIAQLAPYVDRMLLINSQQRRVYEQYGFKRVEEFHYTLPKEAASKNDEPPRWDVLFCGSNFGPSGYPNSILRINVIREIDKHFPNFGVLGAGWDNIGLRNYIGMTYDRTAVVKHMRRARVVLGLNHYDYDHYYPERTWQALASGRAYLVKEIPGMERDFRKGQHLHTFRGVEDVAGAVNHCLWSSRWKGIGASGQSLFRARWCLQKTFRRLMETL